MEIAETETADIAQLAIQSAVKNRIVDSGKTEGLVVYRYDNDGNVASVSTDPRIVNEIQSLATANVQSLLEQVELGIKPDYANFSGIDVERENDKTDGIVTHIPLGRATNNSLLSNLGPSIPVKFRVIGSVETDWFQDFEEAGINNIQLTGWIHVVVKTQVVVPFETEEVKIETKIPIISEFIPLDVPYYYHNGNGEGAQPVIPIHPDQKKENEENG
jgi:sporulation protein YunB